MRNDGVINGEVGKLRYLNKNWMKGRIVSKKSSSLGDSAHTLILKLALNESRTSFKDRDWIMSGKDSTVLLANL